MDRARYGYRVRFTTMSSGSIGGVFYKELIKHLTTYCSFAIRGRMSVVLNRSAAHGGIMPFVQEATVVWAKGCLHISS
jgi:hypothetical protein